MAGGSMEEWPATRNAALLILPVVICAWVLSFAACALLFASLAFATASGIAVCVVILAGASACGGLLVRRNRVVVVGSSTASLCRRLVGWALLGSAGFFLGLSVAAGVASFF